MSHSALQPVPSRNRAAGFGTIGKVARGLSTIAGGVLLGAELGAAAAIGIGLFAAGVFVVTEGLIRR